MNKRHVDRRHQLEQEPFSYHLNKENTVVTIYWNDMQATILRGCSAQKFLTKITHLDRQEAQLLMAKVTGNFKRGNERHDGSKSNKR